MRITRHVSTGRTLVPTGVKTVTAKQKESIVLDPPEYDSTISRIDVKYIYSCGFRCYSVEFLRKYGMRKISGPFDYMFIDIETVFENIQSNFVKYLSDIVFIHKTSNTMKIHYSSSPVNQELVRFFKFPTISYMRINFDQSPMFINQNFVKNADSNLYNWDRACIFNHHELTTPSVYQTLRNRVEIFKKVYEQQTSHLCLFHITRIIETDDLDAYKDNIHNLMKKYEINCYLIVIVCSDRLAETYSFEGKVLFIVKRVLPYKDQFGAGYGNDNNLEDFDYNREARLISKFFNLNLKSYEEIKSTFGVMDGIEPQYGR